MFRALKRDSDRVKRSRVRGYIYITIMLIIAWPIIGQIFRGRNLSFDSTLSYQINIDFFPGVSNKLLNIRCTIFFKEISEDCLNATSLLGSKKLAEPCMDFVFRSVGNLLVTSQAFYLMT